MKAAISLLAACVMVSAESPRAGSPHLANIRQITWGGQNAEAYWSPGGNRLIFQSTRPPLECDQIFIMNVDGADPHLVSTGNGRATCGYFLKDGRIIYSSTHEAGDACPTPPDRSKGYLWGIFPGYDIYMATDTGTILKKLTESAGYDAEATVNWKTNTIVYTSMASGDLDLWTMRPDGSRKKQITKSVGYDGGAVFSRDGKKLVWRANYPSTPDTMERYKSLLKENLTAPMKMELVVANGDGSGAQVITNFGCASFAPTFMPDGKKILFSSNKNKCDSGKFELFLINLDGTGLEQVTDFGGFTAFPEISPEGKRLVFVSDLHAQQPHEFNIFVADWQ
jgi:TolB protein